MAGLTPQQAELYNKLLNLSKGAKAGTLTVQQKALFTQLQDAIRASKSRNKHSAPSQIDVGGSKRGLTIKTLLRMTYEGPFRSRFKNAVDYGVRVVKMSQAVAEDHVMRTSTTEGTKGFTEKKHHNQTIVRLDPKKRFFQSPVALRCSCSDFTFRAEYALARKGCAVLPNSSNLESPEKTNPGLHPFLCVAKGSLVETDQGIIPIELVKQGDGVWTLDGFKTVLGSGLTGVLVPTLRLTTESGAVLEVTPEHEVAVSLDSEDGLSWVSASALKVGHLLIRSTSTEGLVELVEIKSIASGYADVYDLTVDEVHHFTANEFVVHNCKHLIVVAQTILDKAL